MQIRWQIIAHAHTSTFMRYMTGNFKKKIVTLLIITTRKRHTTIFPESRRDSAVTQVPQTTSAHLKLWRSNVFTHNGQWTVSTLLLGSKYRTVVSLSGFDVGRRQCFERKHFELHIFTIILSFVPSSINWVYKYFVKLYRFWIVLKSAWYELLTTGMLNSAHIA